MTRTISVDAIYKTKNVFKNLENFAKRFPESAPFTEFNRDCTIEEIKASLPLTDKYFADGTINNEWTYYFNIDFDQDGMYVWYVERA